MGKNLEMLLGLGTGLALAAASHYAQGSITVQETALCALSGALLFPYGVRFIEIVDEQRDANYARSMERRYDDAVRKFTSIEQDHPYITTKSQ